jgi:4-hydroxythreonine-4-phosphate dehydrogenase
MPHNFKVTPGKADKRAGKFSGDCIKEAAVLCTGNEFDAMITLPVNKHSLNTGGYNFPGHTEMLTKLTRSEDTAMILHSKKINVCPLTTHIPLKEVSKNLDRDKLIRRIITVNNSLVRNFKILSPRLALLSVNPHAGDGGAIGDEEIKILTPVTERLKEVGFNINGPFPADGFFASGYYKNFDVIFSIYHDQGLIPFKIFAFEKGVNFTAGLKIIRTSPDHGTAFDIAGSGKANISSTLEAIKLAYKLSKK